MAGFAALAGGFSLKDFTTTGTWDTFFYASGNINLNGGTLYLSRDFILRPVSSIETLGNIIGNNNKFFLASSINVFPDNNLVDSTCLLSVLDSIGQDDIINQVDWNNTSQNVAIVKDDAGGASEQLIVYDWDGSNLSSPVGIDIGFDINTVSWSPTDDWIAIGRTGGFFDFANVFQVYDFNGVSLTLLDDDIVGFFFTTVFAVAFRPDGDYIAVGVSNGNISIYPIDNTGTLGTAVTVNIGGQDPIAFSWNIDGQYLAVGTTGGGGFDEIRIYEITTGPLAITLNASIGSPSDVAVNSISFNKGNGNEDIIAVGLDGGGDTLQLYRHDSSAGTLSILTQDISFATSINSVDWRSDGLCLVAGFDINSEGLGGELRAFSFSNDILEEDYNEELTLDVYSVKFSPNSSYVAIGDSGPNLNVYEDISQTVVLNSFNWTDVNFLFSNDITLQIASIIFNGDCVVNGMGGSLTLSETSTLVIADGSIVRFKDVTLKNVNTNVLRNHSSTSKIVFDNARISLSGDFELTAGSFDVYNQLIISGNSNIFSMQTDQICTVSSNSQLILKDDVSFNYNPSVSSKNLLRLNDETASIVLNNAVLFTSSVGLELTKGSFFIEGKSFLNNAGTILSQAIDFGDGIAENNLAIEFLPAAQLLLESGFLRNRNV